MAEQVLDQYQVSARIEQVRGKSVTQAVRRVTLGQARRGAGAVKDVAGGIDRHRTHRRIAEKQPVLGLGQAPIGTQHFEQARRQYGQAFLATLAAPDMQHHPLRIDVLKAQVADRRSHDSQLPRPRPQIQGIPARKTHKGSRACTGYCCDCR